MKNFILVVMAIFTWVNINAQEWVKEKAKDGITVYTKSSSDYAMKASKAVMYVSQSPEVVAKAVFDVVNYVKWIPDCSKINIVKTNGANELIYYGLYETPWPAASRDLVISLKKLKITNGYKIEMTNKSSLVEITADAVRIPIYFGAWTITKTDKGTKVVIEYQTDPGGSVPDWMSQGAATKTPFSMFEALKKYIQ